MHAASPEPEPSTPPRRRRRRLLPRRRSFRILLGMLLLLVVVVVVTQIVLWTNIPRDLVLGQIEKQLGLRVSAASLTTGWLGTTHLRDVTIGLPLSDEALARVPSMRVKHNSLLGLALTRAVTLEAVELDEPYLVVRQDEAGRWNVLQVAELLARAGGKQSAADQAQTTSRPTLPAVRLSDATIDVIDNTGRKTTIGNINVRGEPMGALTWKYEVSAGDQSSAAGADGPRFGLTGRLATGGTWEHEVDVEAKNVQRWAQPWTGDAAPPVSVAAEWRGELTDGGVAGRLVLAGLDIADLHVSGSLRAGAEDAGVFTVTPEKLIVQVTGKPLPEVRVTGGRVALDAKAATVEALTVQTSGGTARVDARYDLAKGSADLKARWADLAVPEKELSVGGSLDASLRRPVAGRLVVNANLKSTGTFPAGGWDADLSLGAAGTDWRDMDWQFKADRLTVSGNNPVRLDGLAATVRTRGDFVTLVGVRAPGKVVARGSGVYNLADHDWNLRLDISNLPRPFSYGAPGALALTLNARGTSEYFVLNNPGLSIRDTEAELRIDGAYVYDIPKPVGVNVYVSHIPRRRGAADEPPLFGYLRGAAHLSGTVMRPTNLDITGQLVGRDVRVFQRTIGEIQSDLTGRIDDDSFTLRTDKMELLGGRWQIDALFPDHGALGLNVRVDDLPLSQVGQVLDMPDAEGRIDAQWALIVPELSIDAVKLTGDVKGRELKLGAFKADDLEAGIVLADGTLAVDPVRLRSGEGEADAKAEMDVREFRRLSASLDLKKWPLEPAPGTKVELSGGTQELQVLLPGAIRAEGIRLGMFRPSSKTERIEVRGPIDVSAAFTLGGQPLGDGRLVADLRGRVLDLNTLTFDGLDGTVKGQAVFDIDRPLEARASLSFENFNAGHVPDYFPDNDLLVGLGGRYSGTLRVGPAPGPRPLEPVRIKGEVSSDGGKYRSIDVGAMRLSAFTNFERLVIEDSPANPTTFELAHGLIRLWGRVSLLDPGDELRAPDADSAAAERPLMLSQMQVSFGGLDLDQLVHSLQPDAEPMVGRVAGSFIALTGGPPRRKHGEPSNGQELLEKIVRRITANGRLELTESDLANLDVLAVLYSALSVAPASQNPEGKGDLSFHLEDGVLALNNVRYFNRGIDARAIINAYDIWKMPASPVSGTAVGTARPFRDLKLPFFSTYDLDSILTSLQGDLTTLLISGTVNDPQIEQAGLSDIGGGVRTLLGGDGGNSSNKERRR